MVLARDSQLLTSSCSRSSASLSDDAVVYDGNLIVTRGMGGAALERRVAGMSDRLRTRPLQPNPQPFFLRDTDRKFFR